MRLGPSRLVQGPGFLTAFSSLANQTQRIGEKTEQRPSPGPPDWDSRPFAPMGRSEAHIHSSSDLAPMLTIPCRKRICLTRLLLVPTARPQRQSQFFCSLEEEQSAGALSSPGGPKEVDKVTPMTTRQQPAAGDPAVQLLVSAGRHEGELRVPGAFSHQMRLKCRF